MVHICAWCERFLGLKSPEASVDITHGICDACFATQTSTADDGVPTLVLSRKRSHLLPLLTDLLATRDDIRVVVDRRRNGSLTPTNDRRHGSSLILI